MELFQPDNMIFVSAIIFVIVFGLIELVLLLVGTTISEVLNLDINIPDSPHDHFLEIWSFLNKGSLLVMIWVLLLLTTFGLVGLTLQNISVSITGSVSNGWLMAIPTLVISLLLMRLISPLASKVMIKDETTAMRVELFIGEIATIVIGTTKKGRQTEARYTDLFGQTHYFQVEAIDDNEISKGEKALIVGMFKNKERVFAVVKDFNEDMIENIKQKELFELTAY